MPHTTFTENNIPTTDHILELDQFTPFNSNGPSTPRDKPGSQPPKDVYRPCTEDSCYHDLRCGHRVRSTYPEPCGFDCDNAADGLGFFCPECIERDVRAACELETVSLDMSAPIDDADETMNDTGLSRQQHADQAAEKIIKDMLASGQYRICRIVPKMADPEMQMFERIAEENGMSLLKMEPEKPRKRPGRGTRIPRKKTEAVSGARLDADLVKRSARPMYRYAPYQLPILKMGANFLGVSKDRVDMEPNVIEEDEASRAVREILEKLSLATSRGKISEKG